MPSHRPLKVAEAIREVVAHSILFELSDPRIKNVTVLRVEVPGDLRTAKVFVSVMGPPKTQSLSLRGLQSARGFLQSKVAARLQMKTVPILSFELDDSLRKAQEMAALFARAEAELGLGTRTAAEPPPTAPLDHPPSSHDEPDQSDQETTDTADSPATNQDDPPPCGSPSHPNAADQPPPR
ncbi:ribosome-binding factor A [Isosphaera pallida ATCC 43644]|jgi:ribosome-binding factor A|uniref:Ribosome-binding factor A n=1 Tax=Isosphaera pallida (strain ATCC 43644 / DSM 9630 / IS1B) TaxID=575540 RepID=E8QYY4_ISOPI|nr:30S ribosome-binding factor RbfA [Isosphaera pallida]ADV62121.1 ribosome-binding factor A [Isosphaera pallida ATCC 43644]